MGNDERYEPEYPVLERSMIKPEITLQDEDALQPTMREELRNLRGTDVVYKGVYADTPKNRESMAIRVMYYQMAAFAEGWTFDPQRYRVRFINPNDPVFGEVQMAMTTTGNVVPIRNEKERRVYQYQGDVEDLGIELLVDEGNVRIMSQPETEDTLDRVARVYCTQFNRKQIK